MTNRYRLLFSLSLVLAFLLYIALPKLSAVPDADDDRGLLSLGPSGDYLDAPGKLVVATRLYNSSKTDAFRVDIDSLRLESATLLSPKFPMPLGEIGPGQYATIQADFNSAALAQGTPYRLTVHPVPHNFTPPRSNRTPYPAAITRIALPILPKKKTARGGPSPPAPSFPASPHPAKPN
jgi:hypothetical protein